jgi:hypothetical protein
MFVYNIYNNKPNVCSKNIGYNICQQLPSKNTFHVTNKEQITLKTYKRLNNIIVTYNIIAIFKNIPKQ